MRFLSRHFPATRSAVAKTAAALLLALGALPAAAAPAAEPRILFGNGAAPAVQLLAGDHLAVELAGGQPFGRYEWVLFDDRGAVVVREKRQADAAGNMAAEILWARSGVVGCDRCAAPDPLRYRFASYGEAIEQLAGRKFVVAAFLEGAGTLAPAARRDLPIVRAGEERFFTSDAKGCPRRFFEPAEPIFLTFENLGESPSDRWVYLVPSNEEQPIGTPLRDVRGAGFPQEVKLPPGGGQATVLLWHPPAGAAGGFDAVLRLRGDLAELRTRTDQVLGGPGGPKSTPGLSITVDTSACPPPGPP